MTRAEGDDPQEMIFFEGVREPLEKYWYDGREAVYFCNHCQETPEVDDETQIAVSLSHDACTARAFSDVMRNIGKPHTR